MSLKVRAALPRLLIFVAAGVFVWNVSLLGSTWLYESEQDARQEVRNNLWHHEPVAPFIRSYLATLPRKPEWDRLEVSKDGDIVIIFYRFEPNCNIASSESMDLLVKIDQEIERNHILLEGKPLSVSAERDHLIDPKGQPIVRHYAIAENFFTDVRMKLNPGTWNYQTGQDCLNREPSGGIEPIDR